VPGGSVSYRIELTMKSIGRYPWEQWFKTTKFKLLKGRDYFCKTSGIVGQLRNYATREKYRISIDVADDEKSITVFVLAKLHDDHPTTRPDKKLGRPEDRKRGPYKPSERKSK
jgi:hypothetical protein